MEAGYDLCICGHERDDRRYLIGRYPGKTCEKCTCPDFRRRLSIFIYFPLVLMESYYPLLSSCPLDV